MRASALIAFVISLILYSGLLIGGFILFSASIEDKTVKTEVLIEVPVSLNMFKPVPVTPITAPIKPIVTKPAQDTNQPPRPPKIDKMEITEVAPLIPKKTSQPKPVSKPIPKPIKSVPVAPKKVPDKPKIDLKKEPKRVTPLQSADKHIPTVKPHKPVIAVDLTKAPSTSNTETKTPPTLPALNPSLIAQIEQQYLGRLQATIARYAVDSYPRRAKRRHWQGKVIIEFTLLKQGKITRLKIIESSGRALLDEAAIGIIQERMQNQFDPFPKEISRSTWTITLPIGYTLK